MIQETDMNDHPLSLYVHWPFCVSKCPYCDFNSHVRDAVDMEAFRRAYLRELEHYAPLFARRGIGTVFFGGGTPSLMPPGLTAEILAFARPYFTASDPEITLEANPSSAEAAKLAAFKEAGANRLSVGVQSFDDEALRFLGRAHRADEAERTLEAAAALFGERFSFDLIYARPGQSREAWRQELARAASFGSGHLSLYQLTIETGTPFYYAYKKGEFAMKSEDELAELHAETAEIMEGYGFRNYEISNYAKPGFESRHNLQYWRYRDYVGVGPGAHGRYADADGKRVATVTVHHPEKWAEQAGKEGHGVQHRKEVGREESVTELLLTGMRLTEGASVAALAEIVGKIPSLSALAPLYEEGLLERNEEYLRCTPKGRLVHGAVIRYVKARLLLPPSSL
jgi:putative oxygen-independent coproporphyrinogen III oxidase